MSTPDAATGKKRARTSAGTNGRSPASRAGAKRIASVPNEGRHYHHGNLRDELIRCGKQRLKDGDGPELSLRQIAADAGVSQVAPKHHFGNKEGLLAAIAASGFRDLTEFRYSRLRPSMGAEQRLRIMLSSYVQFAVLNPALFHLMFSPQFKAQDHAELMESASQSYQLLLHAAAEFLKESGRGKDNPTAADDAARMGWISMHGLATLLMEHRINPLGAPRYRPEQLLERTLDMVFASVRTL